MKRLLYICIAIVLLGTTGCEKNEHSPYYVLWLSAKVVDEVGEPIEGIHLYLEGGEFVGRTGYTDYKGEISGARSYTPPMERWIVHIEDVDGEYNRGEYESVTIDITNRVKAPSAPDRSGFTGSDIVDLGRVVLKRK